MSKIIRVLIGKVGLDGHDVGARVVAKALVDAGMEVIYTGLRQTPEMIVKTAIEENVDIVGISSLSGSHLTLFQEVLRQMKLHGIGDVPFVAGGIIPAEDVPALKEMGVAEVFPPETPTAEITKAVKALVK
ncbi:MAG: cobalamin B12-binding domain-containing protein [Chloroflexota bacterium]